MRCISGMMRTIIYILCIINFDRFIDETPTEYQYRFDKFSDTKINVNFFSDFFSEINYEAVFSIHWACGNCHKFFGRTSQGERRHWSSHWYRFRNNILMVCKT